MCCCFNCLTLTVPRTEDALLPERSSSAYTGSIGMPQGAMPGSSEMLVGLLGRHSVSTPSLSVGGAVAGAKLIDPDASDKRNDEKYE